LLSKPVSVNDRLNNAILRQLAIDDRAVYEHLLADLEPVALEQRAELSSPHERLRWVYFLESAIVSVMGSTANGQSVEVAFVGEEGMAGVPDVLPLGLVVQVAGLAYRAPIDVAERHVFSCTALQRLLLSQAQSMMLQLAQSAVCNRFHTSVQRLARWLLTAVDRAHTDRLELTHEFLAQMVGAPRSAVTQAASTLRRRGIIHYERGVVAIRSRSRLHAAACECADVVLTSVAAV
jgi:CRP-like cAMP-binding protein